MAKTQSTEPQVLRSPFTWNGGGWLGTVLGCTLWLFLLGLVLLSRDLPAAVTSLLCAGLLTALGVHLWSSRAHLSAYAGIQRFLGGCSVGYGVVILTVNLRGASSSPLEAGPISTYLPYWALLIAPVMMLVMHIMNRRPSTNPTTQRDQGSTR